MLLSDLPADDLLLIIRYLSVPETLRLRQTCRTICQATKIHAVWHNFLYSEIYQHNIALLDLEDRIPDTLSSTELEHVIVKALRLHFLWTSPSPIAHARYSLPLASEAKALHFYMHQTRPYLFSDSFVTPIERVIDCWDISGIPPTRLASRRIPAQASISFNQDADNAVIFTVALTSHIELIGMDFSQNTGTFVTRGTIPVPGLQTRYLSGLKLILQQSDDTRTLMYRDTEHPEFQIALRSQYAEAPFLDAILCNAFVIILRSTSFAVYEIPSDPSVRYLMPIVEESLRQVYQGRLACLARRSGRGAINMLIKYSASPWSSPANYIHHYTLFPNHSYDLTQSSSPHNLPYHFPATLTQTIGVPVRTLGFSDLPVALGPFGTAIWIDNHIEDYYGPIPTGQRLAGKILNDERDDDDLSDNVMAATMASTVYDVQQEDSWTCVAMDERAGRIAVGGKVGTSVLEYM